jgi:hypothetical protein
VGRKMAVLRGNSAFWRSFPYKNGGFYYENRCFEGFLHINGCFEVRIGRFGRFCI